MLDTSAILSGKDIPLNEVLYIPPGVMDEIQEGGRWHRKLQMMRSAGLEVVSPNAPFLEKVNKRASKTGDEIRLSDTDKEVVALALQMEANILTDDYSIQNIAKSLGIEFHGIAQDEIDEEYEWEYRCVKCRRWHKEPHDECPVCGGEVRSARLVG